MKEEENVLGFNFWPAFTDIMLSLVLILIVIIFIFAAVINAGAINLNHVEKNQVELVNTISEACKNDYKVSTDPNSNADIIIVSDLDRQKITFSEHVLFATDQYFVKDIGQRALYIVGNALKDKIGDIREIQIQGHADIGQTRSYPQFGNMELASYRALAVFSFLQNNIGIDPAEHMMSATSFGEFKPVARPDESSYTREQLLKDNENYEMKNRNRRIELLIFYKK